MTRYIVHMLRTDLKPLARFKTVWPMLKPSGPFYMLYMYMKYSPASCSSTLSLSQHGKMTTTKRQQQQQKMISATRSSRRRRPPTIGPTTMATLELASSLSA